MDVSPGKTSHDLIIPWQESAIRRTGTLVSMSPPLDYLDALRTASPSIHAEFQHLCESWAQTESVTRGKFHALVRLMHQNGSTEEAEYYLRTHLLVTEDGESWFLDASGLDLYTELFASGRREKFAAAILAFQTQFSAQLSNPTGGGFEVGYEMVTRSDCFDPYGMRNTPCNLRIEYYGRDSLEAEVWLKSDFDGPLFSFQYATDVWERLGPDGSSKEDAHG